MLDFASDLFFLGIQEKNEQQKKIRPATTRTTLPPCYEDGPPLLPDAPVPVLPVARRVSRPQSAARSRSQVEPFRRGGVEDGEGEERRKQKPVS